jgi:serine/threonine protein kinase/HAMP domain-containing protein
MADSEASDGQDRARPGDAGAHAAALERRVAALEKVVAIERRLREVQRAGRAITPVADDAAVLHRTAPVPDDDSTVLHRAAPAPAFDDDSTVLHRPAPLADDSTVLHHRPSRSLFAPSMAASMVPPVAPAAPLESDGGATPLVLAPGFHLFEYRIDAVLGQGGFGVTYLATDIHLNTKVAIKEYLPAELAQRSGDKSVAPRWPEDVALYQDGLESFLVEARTLATFRHPNIVRVARFFEANRTAYMVLEYERGQPLKQWWPARKEAGESELLGLMQPLLDGLAVVHEAGFLHRDIKPDNIYRRKDDGSLVLLDFGAARLAVGAPGAQADVVTPGYAPPEQYGGGAQGPWTDIYALGATLYWMISGDKPPAAPARLAGASVMVSAVEAGKGRYSEAFLRAVDWALEPDSAARPQRLQAFAQKLFASHAGSLALQDALRDGEAEPNFGNDSLRALLDSPRLLKRRALQLGRSLLQPASWPLVVRMTIAMMVAALLPMLMTAYYNLNGSVTAVSASEMRNLQRIAKSSAGQVAQLIEDSQNLANYAATEAEFIDYLRRPDNARKQVVQAKLGNLIRTNPDVALIFLMDPRGVALVSSGPGVEGNDYSFREYFKQAVRGRAARTGILVGSSDGKRGMFYANPVFNEAGAVAGVVVLRIKASSIADILERITAGTGRVPFMIDGDGILIYYPDEKQLHRSLGELGPQAQQRIAADKRFARARIDSVHMPVLARTLIGAKGPGSVTYMSTMSGEEEHAGYAPVKGHDWVVGITESRRLFEAPLRKLFLNVLYSVALVGLLFLVLAVLFARSIVRPIARLTAAANALKEGDYDNANIKVTSNDEIGRLARTFNVMIDVLRQREREKRRGRRAGRERAGD